MVKILLLTLIISLFNSMIYFGCAAKQIKNDQNAYTAETSPADTVKKYQIITQLQDKKFKKTMDYPYLIVKFYQNDTEVELVLDPLSTNLTLDLVRGSEGYLEILKGDSILYQEEDSSLADNLLTGLENNKKSEELMDEIFQDINLAQKLFYQKRYNEALKILQASLQKKKTSTAYALGGSIYYVNGDIEEAVKAWENALKINPNLEDVRQLIMKYKN